MIFGCVRATFPIVSSARFVIRLGISLEPNSTPRGCVGGCCCARPLRAESLK